MSKKEIIDWKEEYLDYMNFLERDIEEYKSDEEYKEALREEIENIIAINGYAGLLDREGRLLRLLKTN